MNLFGQVYRKKHLSKSNDQIHQTNHPCSPISDIAGNYFNVYNMKTKPLTDCEWTTCWMAYRYSMNSQTIATSTLPGLLITTYWHRWSDNQKRMIARDLKSNEKEYSDRNKKAFGDETIDRPTWLKFMAACDIDNHYTVRCKDGNEYVVFEANGRKYPLTKYIKNPCYEIWCPEEMILLNP